MERQRSIKILSIVALVVAIAGMSLGFAAFSATLNISSSASVSPSSSSFYLGFYESDFGGNSDIPDRASGSVTTSGGATASSLTFQNGSTSLSGISANFTEPGQTVSFEIYVGNKSLYDAYLRAINFLNVSGTSSNKVCFAGNGATVSLVESACNAITMTVEVNGYTATETNTSFSRYSLAKGAFTPVTITISYASDGARADGPFNVTFGDITLDYSTVDGVPNIFEFTIDGMKYYAEEGMKWSEWINSDYNVQVRSYYSKFMLSGNCVCTILGYDSEPVEWVNSMVLYSADYDDYVLPSDIVLDFDYILM